MPLRKKHLVLFFVTLFTFLVTVGIFFGYVPLFIGLIYFITSLLAFLLFALDKSAAKGNSRRIPENTLHLVSLTGGWPGALVAQELFRHKTQKTEFQIIGWFTVIINCLVIFYTVKLITH